MFALVGVLAFTGCYLDSASVNEGGTAGSERIGAMPVMRDTTELPDRVLFRSNTCSFNSAYYAVTINGDIWVKPNVEQSGNDGPWQKLDLPEGLDGDVTGIAMDGEHIIALNGERQIYTMWNGLDPVSGFRWQREWGFPFWMGPGMCLRDDIIKWDWSVVSPREDENYTDPAGHLFPVGIGKCSHIWMLGADGQRLTYVDPWLPTDYSYEITTPFRGRFKAVNLSASGSYLFIIDKYGDMYTRFFDFDIGGVDNLFYQYSYYDQTNKLVPVIQLPTASWIMQPKIAGTITDRISIHRIGKNCVHRTLRVEGTDAAGNTGYYEKDVQQPSQWVFHRTDLPLLGRVLDNRPHDCSLLTPGRSEDQYYERNMSGTASLAGDIPWWKIIDDADWTAELLDFNCYDSPAILRVHLSPTSYIDLLLHTRDRIRLLPRERGLDGNPRLFSGTIEVPRAILSSLGSRSRKVQKFIGSYLMGRQFVTVDVSGTRDAIRVSGTAGGLYINWAFTRGDR
jgi:hypothetical protein